MKTTDNKGIFDSPHAKVVDSFNIYHQKPPPTGHPNAVLCTQCEQHTWRMTDCCIHCGFNIAADTQERIRLEHLEQLRHDEQRLKSKLLPFLILMLSCAIGLILVMFLVPKKPFIYWIIIGIMLILVAFIKPLADRIESIRNQIRTLQ